MSQQTEPWQLQAAFDIVRKQDATIKRQEDEIERLLKEVARQERHLQRQNRALEEGWKALASLPIKVDNTLTFAAACAQISEILEKLAADTDQFRQKWQDARSQSRALGRELERVRNLDGDRPNPRRQRALPEQLP